MIIKTEYSLKKLTIFSVAVLGMCFWASDSIAQSEREKSEVENVKPIEKPLVENQSDRFDVQIRENQVPSATTIISSKTPLPKKDITLSGEGKKPETAPSTLSFNIFLYIVDKFKAD
jgi:hypothetical protein